MTLSGDTRSSWATPHAKLSAFLQAVEQSVSKHLRTETSTLRYAMTDAQRYRYMRAVCEVSTSRCVPVVTPEILFEAADIAVAGDVCLVEARVGLQPGTMNPIHDGHLLVSLGAVIAANLDVVLLAYGCTVPDKPDSTDPRVRHDMATIALCEREATDWIRVTPIRHQLFDMFSENGHTLSLAGETESARRFNIDIAAFIWLFRANPRVTWAYIVGADKVAAYGRNQENALVAQTLGDKRVNARVIYFARSSEDIDVPVHIAPYRWMFDRWQSGFFEKSPLSTWHLSASAIRKAIAAGSDHVDGVPLEDCVSPGVLRYIRDNCELLASYGREVRQSIE